MAVSAHDQRSNFQFLDLAFQHPHRAIARRDGPLLDLIAVHSEKMGDNACISSRQFLACIDKSDSNKPVLSDPGQSKRKVQRELAAPTCTFAIVRKEAATTQTGGPIYFGLGQRPLSAHG
jgi:hypothetical protein